MKTITTTDGTEIFTRTGARSQTDRLQSRLAAVSKRRLGCPVLFFLRMATASSPMTGAGTDARHRRATVTTWTTSSTTWSPVTDPLTDQSSRARAGHRPALRDSLAIGRVTKSPVLVRPRARPAVTEDHAATGAGGQGGHLPAAWPAAAGPRRDRGAQPDPAGLPGRGGRAGSTDPRSARRRSIPRQRGPRTGGARE